MRKNLRWLAFILLASILCCFGAACNESDQDSIRLNYKNYTLEVGETVLLTVTSDSNESIEWQSLDSELAIVSDGQVLAKNIGVVTIIAIQGNNVARCTIVIKKSSMSLNHSHVNLSVGGYVWLKVDSSSTASVSWQTSDSAVASVLANGWVTAKKSGTAIITATQGYSEVTCVIEVR